MPDERPLPKLFLATERLCRFGIALNWLLFTVAALLLVLRSASHAGLLPLLLIPPGLLVAILVHAVLVNAIAVIGLGPAGRSGPGES